MKVLVTGAAGFIGMHAAERLLARGDAVIGVDNFSPYYSVELKKARLARLTGKKGFSFHEADIANEKGLKEIFGKDFEKIAKEQIILIKEISEHIEGINANVESMIEARKKANVMTNAQEMAESYCDEVRPYFAIIRRHCDKLELLVDNELWTLPKYRELLFIK